MKTLRTEKEITDSWAGDSNKPIISICCAAYNHENYIEEALNGFLIQETKFPFEIIVHDDASTDSTTSIIRQYEKKYPRIIKPIYQIENKYSQGFKIGAHFLYPKAKGIYLAFCEGDDYWICKNKLENQILFLEKNPDIYLSIHPAHILTDGNLVGLSVRHSSSETILSPKLVYTTSGQFCATASMVVVKERIESLPEFFFNVPVGDFFIQALAGINGIHYFPDICSVYRLGNVGSWTNTVFNNHEQYLLKSTKMLKSLNDLHLYLRYPDNKYVQYKINTIYLNLANVYLKQGDFKKFKKNWLLSMKSLRAPRKTDIRLFFGFFKIKF